MVKRGSLIALILGISDILLVLVMLLNDHDKYLYGKFVFDSRTFSILIVNIISILIFNAVIALTILVCKNRRKALLVLLIPVCLVCGYLVTVIMGFTSAGAFWCSETDNHAEFDEVDDYLDRCVSIAGMKPSDILEPEMQRVENFYYRYESNMLGIRFSIKGKFYLSEKDYEAIKEAFSNSLEFDEVIPSPEEQIELGITGYYDLNPDMPIYESQTSVDEWDSIYIGFSDEEHSIALDLQGWQDT